MIGESPRCHAARVGMPAGRCWLPLVAAVLLSPAALGDGPGFRQVQLPYGISIEAPAHWYYVERDDRHNLVLTGRSLAEAAGLTDVGHRERLLAVNATPSPPGAMIGLTVSWPSELTQQDLKRITRRELAELAKELERFIRRAEAQGGPRLLEMQGVSVESLNGRRALVVRYRRAGGRGPSPFQVTQYKIPVEGGMVELTLSNRESDGPIWRPILAHVKQSLQVPQ